jgi:hypothetical protein
MENVFQSNVSSAEQARRYVIGAALVALALGNSTFPAWIALVACYPIFTAMIKWDPVNTLIQVALNKAHGNQAAFVVDTRTTA